MALADGAPHGVTNSAASPASSGDRWLPVIDGIVEYAFHALVFVMPLAFYVEGQFRIFEYAKLRLLYTAAAVILGGWLASIVVRRRLIIRRTPLDVPLLAYVAALALATACSTNLTRSLWGRPDTPAGAFSPIATCAALYFAFVATMRTRRQLYRHAGWLLAGGVAAAAYGLVQHYGLDPFITGLVIPLTERSIGALGNASPQGWYLGLMMPIAAWGFYQAGGAARAAAGAAWCLLVMSLLSTGTRGGYVGAVCGLLVTVGALLVVKRKYGALTLKPLLVLAVLAALSMGVYALPSQAADMTAPTASNTIESGASDAATAYGRTDGRDRLPIWRDAVRIWRAHPIVGTGPETFGDQHNLIRSAQTYKDFLVMFGHAHNQYLQVLATSGLVGFAAFLVLVGAGLVSVARRVARAAALAESGQVPHAQLWAIALASGYISIAASQNFNPDFVPTTLLFYLLPAMAMCWAFLEDEPRTWDIALDIRPFAQAVAAAGLVLGVAIALQFNLRSWNAFLSYQQALDVLLQGRVMVARDLIDRAIDANPSDANFWWVKAQTYASLAVVLNRERRDFGLMQASERVAVASSDRSVAIDPHREDLWRQRSICFRDLAEVDPKLVGVAIEAIQQAMARFPENGLNYLFLARLQARAGRTDAALTALQTAATLTPGLHIVWAELGALCYRIHDVSQAGAAVDTFLKLGPQPAHRNVVATLRDEAGRAGDESRRAALDARLARMPAASPAPRAP